MRISDWSSDVCSSDLYVRYLYGAPLALLLAGTWFGALDHPEPEVPARFWPIIATAGVAQIAATIALLRSFQARGFALGTVYSKTEVIQVAIVGALVLGDRKSTRLNSSH